MISGIGAGGLRRQPAGSLLSKILAERKSPMLVLSRKVGETILIGEKISVTVVQFAPGVVRLGIQVPDNYTILRSEIAGMEQAEDACQTGSTPMTRPHARLENCKVLVPTLRVGTHGRALLHAIGWFVVLSSCTAAAGQSPAESPKESDRPLIPVCMMVDDPAPFINNRCDGR